MTWLARLKRLPLARWVEAFVVANLAFLALDILIAHEANDFARREEWIPVAFSTVAPLLLAPGLVSARYRERTRTLALCLGAAAIVVGIAGMLFHLESSFFGQLTLRRLVYTAPFVAPLSYVGVGLLLVLNRLEPWDSVEWSRWVVFLALGGFLGNLLLSLLDHAQNGFFYVSEWVPVVAAAFASSFLLLVVLEPGDRRLRKVTAAVLLGAGIVGLAGFALHLRADVYTRPGHSWQERLIHGAPVFAPLLFPNLAVLAALGLSALSRANRAS